MAVYTLEDKDGNLFPLHCSYVSVEAQRGSMAPNIGAAPYSIFQTVTSDSHAVPRAYVLEGVEWVWQPNQTLTLTQKLDMVRAEVRKAVKLHRSNDSTLDLIPGQHAHAEWEPGDGLMITKTMKIILVPQYRLDVTDTSEGLLPPPLPIEVVTQPGPTGPQGPQGLPGLGVPIPSFMADDGKIPVAAVSSPNNYYLQHIITRLVAGNNVSIEELPNGQARISSTGGGGGGGGGSLESRVSTLETTMNDLQLQKVEDRLGETTLKNVVYNDDLGFIGLPYTARMTFRGIPTANQEERILIDTDCRLYYGMTIRATQVATATTIFTIYRNGDQIGDITFGPGSATGYFTLISPHEFDLSWGDWLTVIAPSTPDATLENIHITFGVYTR